MEAGEADGRINFNAESPEIPQPPPEKINVNVNAKSPAIIRPPPEKRMKLAATAPERSAQPDPLDISGATRMVVYPHELDRQGAYVSCFRVFLEECLDRRTLQDVKLLSVDKLSLRPTCHHFYYLTFTVVDELTNEKTTFQAQIIEFVVEQFMLGLLRDASHDRVVAVMHIE